VDVVQEFIAYFPLE